MGSAEYEISTDRARIDVERVHRWLSTDAYWSLGRPRDVVQRAVDNSLNVGLHHRDDGQVGYARVVTDHATFAWLCDVYLDRAHRGRGLGVRLVTAARDELAPLQLSRFMLATADAHGLYARLGFAPLPDPERIMMIDGRRKPDQQRTD